MKTYSEFYSVDEIIDERKKESERGNVCGMLGCPKRPTSKCTICGNHYCYDHFKFHFHTKEDIRE